MNILIVDDERIAIEGIMANIDFSLYGIQEVFTANSMNQAKEIVEKMQVDIIICDIEMPNGSGLELIEWINECEPHIISIILSCHNEFEFAQQAVSLACQQYILKPATPDILAAAVTKAVQQAQLRESEGKIRKIGAEYVQKLAGTDPEDIGAVEKVRRYIVEHVQEELSVEKLARMAYMSQNHLTRSFKKKYGKTVTEYITDYRLSLAKELLSGTDLTVTMVSAKVGYPNYAYFTRQFKRISGHTPSSYRNNYGKFKE